MENVKVLLNIRMMRDTTEKQVKAAKTCCYHLPFCKHVQLTLCPYENYHFNLLSIQKL